MPMRRYSTNGIAELMAKLLIEIISFEINWHIKVSQEISIPFPLP